MRTSALNSPKRLLFIANDFPNPYEPTKGVFNGQMVRALAADCDVQVVAPLSWVTELAASFPRRFSLERIRSNEGVRVHYPRYWYTPKSLRRFYGTFLWWSVRKTIRQILDESAPDAVLGYWAHPDGAVAVRAARQAGVPAVIMVGGSDVLLLTGRRMRRRCILRVLNAADAVVAVSEHLRTKLIDLGVAPQKVHVVCRGVDDAIFYPGDRAEARRKLGIPSDKPVLLWVGRMVPVKGLDVLLAACGRLQEQGAEFQLYLIGDGPVRAALAAQRQVLGLDDAVTFLGPLEHNRLVDWYRAANVTVLPSRSEGIPNVLRESLACGTPFVASRVGGIPEIANQHNSRLVEPDDSDELAAAIREMFNADPARSFPTGSPSWAQSASALLDVIASLRRGSVGDLGMTPAQRAWASVAAARPAFWKRWTKTALATLLPRRLFLTHGSTSSGAVCLTFDDGPHPEYTPRLLDVLQRQRIRATFFVVGQLAEQYPDLVQRMAAEGHAVGHHSYTHMRPQATSACRLGDEVRRSCDLLGRLLGKPVSLFRPPHGHLTAAKLWRLWQAQQTVVLWNRDPKDYACPAPDLLSQWFRRQPLQAGDLVLLHDSRAHAATVVSEIADCVRRRGMGFATIPEWISC
jgi:glycosyltransferase involved in cell wall biosynthesis/peptidoglycan/xylan/chitin deacetylase (PgdA/CDA1 family)